MDVKFVSGRGVTWDDTLYTSDQLSLTNNYDLGAPQIRSWTAQPPYCDGENDYGGTIAPRDIFLEYILMTESTIERDDFIRTLKTAFNPYDGLGLLTLTMADLSEYAIWAKPTGEPKCLAGSGRGYNYQFVQIDLRAPYPFFINPALRSSSLSSFTGGISFPLTFPMTFGLATQEATLTNSGNVPTPVIITFIGAITNPRIDLTNEAYPAGKHLSATMALGSGEVLTINTGQGQHTVRYIHGTTDDNGFQYLDSDSEFFWLEPGENILSFSSSSSIGADASCLIEYYDQYIGV